MQLKFFATSSKASAALFSLSPQLFIFKRSLKLFYSSDAAKKCDMEFLRKLRSWKTVPTFRRVARTLVLKWFAISKMHFVGVARCGAEKCWNIQSAIISLEKAENLIYRCFEVEQVSQALADKQVVTLTIIVRVRRKFLHASLTTAKTFPQATSNRRATVVRCRPVKCELFYKCYKYFTTQASSLIAIVAS